MGRTSYEWYWAASKLKAIGIPLAEEETRALHFSKVNGDIYFCTYSGSGFFAEKSKLYRLDQSGVLQQLFESPGRMLTCLINPQNINHLLISSEGYPEGDPRLQSLFYVDTTNSDQETNWHIIEHPGFNPQGGRQELFTGKTFFLDNEWLYYIRYGFGPENEEGIEDEGAGLWVVKLDDYNQKTRINNLSHVLSWSVPGHRMALETEESNTVVQAQPKLSELTYQAFLPIVTKPYQALFTLKNSSRLVHADFSDLPQNNTIVDAKMVGWNPKIRSVAKKEDGSITVYAETYFDLQSSVDLYPNGVFEIEIPK